MFTRSDYTSSDGTGLAAWLMHNAITTAGQARINTKYEHTYATLSYASLPCRDEPKLLFVGELFQDFVGNVEITEDILDVVVIVEKIDHAENGFSII